MVEVKLAREAMRVRFEMLLRGVDAARLRGAGEEAMEEILTIEQLLSPFSPTSDLYRVNAEGHTRPVPISGTTAIFLARAQELTEATGGMFDLTATSGGGGFTLSDAEVQLPTSTSKLDPGGLAKGWALERAAELLIEAGVTSALLHGGTSSIVAFGPDAWSIAIAGTTLTIPLKNSALSVSGTLDRAHVYDPSTGKPIEGARLTVAQTDSATEAEALSTALLVTGEIAPIAAQFPRASLWLF